MLRNSNDQKPSREVIEKNEALLGLLAAASQTRARVVSLSLGNKIYHLKEEKLPELVGQLSSLTLLVNDEATDAFKRIMEQYGHKSVDQTVRGTTIYTINRTDPNHAELLAKLAECAFTEVKQRVTDHMSTLHQRNVSGKLSVIQELTASYGKLTFNEMLADSDKAREQRDAFAKAHEIKKMLEREYGTLRSQHEEAKHALAKIQAQFVIATGGDCSNHMHQSVAKTLDHTLAELVPQPDAAAKSV